MRENRESFYDLFLCSRRSRCSRFMFLKRSVRCNFHRETRENREQRRERLQEDLTAKCAKTANKKGRDQGELSPSLKRGNESREGRRGPRSYRSRCSRFRIFNQRAHCNSNRETCEQRKECLQEDLTAKHAKTANKKGSVRYRLGE